MCCLFSDAVHHRCLNTCAMLRSSGGAATGLSWRSSWLCDFLCFFHGHCLHLCSFPFVLAAGISDLATTTQGGCKTTVKNQPLSLAPQDCGSPPRPQQSARHSGSLTRVIHSWWLLSTMSFSPPVKLCYKARISHIQAAHIFLTSDFLLIVPYPEEPRSSLEVGSLFQSHCLLDIPGIQNLGKN